MSSLIISLLTIGLMVSNQLYTMESNVLLETDDSVDQLVPRPLSLHYLNDYNKKCSVLLSHTAIYQNFRQSIQLYRVDLNMLKKYDINIVYEDGQTPFSLWVHSGGIYENNGMECLKKIFAIHTVINTSPVLTSPTKNAMNVLSTIIKYDIKNRDKDKKLFLLPKLLQNADEKARGYALGRLIYEWAHPLRIYKALSEKNMHVTIDIFNQYPLDYNALTRVISMVEKKSPTIYQQLKEVWSKHSLADDFQYIKDEHPEDQDTYTSNKKDLRCIII